MPLGTCSLPSRYQELRHCQDEVEGPCGSNLGFRGQAHVASMCWGGRQEGVVGGGEVKEEEERRGEGKNRKEGTDRGRRERESVDVIHIQT